MTSRARVAAIVDGQFLLYGIVVAVQGPILPALQRTLHATPSDLGLVLAAGSGGATIAVLFGGALADRTGKKLTLLCGALGIFVFAELFAASRTLTLAFVAMLLLGMAGGLVDGSANALLADLFPEGSGFALSLGHFFYGAGALAGPVYAGWMVETRFGWQGVYLGIGALALVFGLALFGIRLDSARVARLPQALPWRAVVFKKVSFVALLAIMLSVAAELGLSAWLVYYLVNVRRLDLFVSSLVLSLFFGALTLGRLGCSWIALHAPPTTIIWGSALLGALAYAGMLLAPSPRLLFAAVAIGGLGCAGLFPMLMAWTAARFPNNTGAVAGLLVAGADCGGTVAVWLVGYITGHVTVAAFSGVTLGLAPLSVCLLVVFLLFFRVERRAKSSG